MKSNLLKIALGLAAVTLVAALSLLPQRATQLPTTQQVTASVAQPATVAPLEEPPEEPPTLVESILETMTTQEKIGQLFMIDFRTDESGAPMLTLSQTAQEQIESYHLGGVILFGENLDTAEQTTALTAQMQDCAQLPLLIGVDEEGGTVSRLGSSSIDHEVIPKAGNIPSNEAAAAAGTSIGETLVSLGIQVDFAPVADVNTNPANPVIGSRAYSDDPDIAAQRVSAFVTALQETGIAGAAKHFPGHGDTSTDSHTGSAEVTHDLERLEVVEFLPFQAAIEAGVQMILVGHIQLPNVTGDDIPATLNPQIIDLLRTNLGYDGVVITDAMNMGAITTRYGAGESAVLSILAGIDIVLMPADLSQAFAAVEEAVANGRISIENLEDSVTRILQLKNDLGLLAPYD